jgi:hypothetical protein
MTQRIVRSYRMSGYRLDTEKLRELTADGAVGLIDAGMFVFRVERITDPDVLKAPDPATALEMKLNFDPQGVLHTILTSMPLTEERDEALEQLHTWLANGGWAPRVPKRTNCQGNMIWLNSTRRLGLHVPLDLTPPSVIEYGGAGIVNRYVLQREE